MGEGITRDRVAEALEEVGVAVENPESLLAPDQPVPRQAEVVELKQSIGRKAEVYGKLDLNYHNASGEYYKRHLLFINSSDGGFVEVKDGNPDGVLVGNMFGSKDIGRDAMNTDADTAFTPNALLGNSMSSDRGDDYLAIMDTGAYTAFGAAVDDVDKGYRLEDIVVYGLPQT